MKYSIRPDLIVSIDLGDGVAFEKPKEMLPLFSEDVAQVMVEKLSDALEERLLNGDTRSDRRWSGQIWLDDYERPEKEVK